MNLVKSSDRTRFSVLYPCLIYNADLLGQLPLLIHPSLSLSFQFSFDLIFFPVMSAVLLNSSDVQASYASFKGGVILCGAWKEACSSYACFS